MDAAPRSAVGIPGMSAVISEASLALARFRARNRSPLPTIVTTLKVAALMDETFAVQLLATASQGQLMIWMTNPELTEEERQHAIDCLAQMHRARRIDVFEHMHRPPEHDEWHLDYGLWSRAYRDLVPVLDDEACRVVSAVVGLGTGFWEPTFQEAFLDWCLRDGGRIDRVLELASRPEIPDFCFAAALIAGLRTNPSAYFNVAVEYAQGSYRSRMPGIRALSAISLQDDGTVERALSILGGIVEDGHAPARDRADALTAVVEVAQRSDGSLDGQVSRIMSSATASGQAELLHACCDVIVRFGAKLRDSVLPSVLEAFRSLDINASAGRSSVDMPLYSLLTSGRRKEALSCLEILLRRSKANDPLDALGSTTHHLATTTVDLLPFVICRWLLTGDRALCAAARYLLTSTGNQKLAFDFDPGNRDWPDSRALYLARKAIGWLMPHGTAPASFVVCLLRGASEDAGKELGELLFNPLLVNYPLATRTYLNAVCSNLPDKAKACVEAILARDDRYKQSIEDVGFVPELQPTERQRWIENKRRGEEWDEAQSSAKGQSVFAQMFTRQTLLYGTRAIGYVDDPGGGTRRLDNHLGTISHTADNAMGLIYDPFGLDYTLRVFRAERNPE